MENHEDSHHGLVPDEVITEGLSESAMTQQMEQSVAPAPDQTSEPAPGPAQEPTQEPALDDLEPQLDPEILSALGEATDQGPIWGQEIHSNLSQLWLPLLKKGMTKEAREKILKEYVIPSNCMLLQAPKLNIEISAAVAEMVRIRDKKVETMQQQLGSGITAISRAMTSLLTNDNNKIEAIKTLSDACRILCDLHCSETQARIKMVTPGLTKSFLNIIQDSERDETLFGNTLPDKIKAAKTVEKQGLQIKKTGPATRSSTVCQSQNLPARQQLQGNWAGPSRYPTNRGGRGGHRRYPTSTRRSAPMAAATMSQPKTGQGRSRVPARQ